jgi:hypothetical protein
MKCFLTCLALGIAFAAGAQTISSTYDPDVDADGNIGVNDLLALLGLFGENDADGDGVWDSQDDCIGVIDACGICNGPGPNVVVIDTILVSYDSIYVEAIDFWYVYETSADTLYTITCDEDLAYCEDPGACNWQENNECDYSCIGCFDPSAVNYNPWATTSDYCEYCEVGTYNLNIEMLDTEGDGWNGASYTLTNLGNTTEVYSGTFDEALSVGIDGFTSICLVPGCYVFIHEGGDANNSVTLTDQFGTVYASDVLSGAAVQIDFLLGGSCD